MTNCKPTSQMYFDNLFQNNLSGLLVTWNQIYTLPRKVTIYSYMHCFQYKIINNMLFLNENLYIFQISITPQCLFCHAKEETTFQFFFECCKTQSLQEELRKYFHYDFPLPILSPQTALYGFLDFSEASCSYLIIFFLFLSSIFIKLGKKKLKTVSILKCC